MSRRAAALLLLVAGAACNPPVDGAPCAGDGECPEGQSCSPLGQCEPAPDGGEARGSAAGCPDAPAGTLVVAMGGGSDAIGNGSSACPLATVTKALAVAAASGGAVTISVHAGPQAYSVATGERLPLVLGPGVSLVAASGETPRLAGAGPVGDGSSSLAAVWMQGGVLQGFELLGSGAPLGDGVYCTAGSPALSGDEIHGFAAGVVVAGSCAATLDRCDVHDEGQESQPGVGVEVIDEASASVAGSRIHANGTGAIVRSTGATPTEFAGVEVTGNSADGVDCLETSRLSMRSSFVHANGAVGVSISGACAADLSGADAAGGCGAANTFVCNGEHDLSTTSSSPVAADHDDWDQDPPGEEDVFVAEGSAVTLSPTCTNVAGASNPAPPPTGCQ